MRGDGAKYSVEVRLFANLREAADTGALELGFESAPTVGEVIDEAIANRPALGKILRKGGKFNDKYKVLVGQDLVAPEDFSKPAGTRVALLPPVSGG